MKTASSDIVIRKKAMDLLARREHSVDELRRKLRSRDFDHAAIDLELEQLQVNGLLSDTRFTEAFVNQRFSAGAGPLKIEYELRQRGVAESLIAHHLEAFDGLWQESMERERRRRFGNGIPADYASRMKQARFLQNRGFSPDSVMRLFR